MADPRPCYACQAKACGLRDLRPQGGAVELACRLHRDRALCRELAFRCEACAEVRRPLSLLETRRGMRWLCGDCELRPELGAEVPVLELGPVTTTTATKEPYDA